MLFNTRQREEKKIMVNKSFFPHWEVIDAFHNKFYIPTIDFFHFIFIMLVFLVQCNIVRLEIMIFIKFIKKLKLKKCYAETFSKTTHIYIQVNIWVETGNYQWKELLLNIL